MGFWIFLPYISSKRQGKHHITNIIGTAYYYNGLIFLKYVFSHRKFTKRTETKIENLFAYAKTLPHDSRMMSFVGNIFSDTENFLPSICFINNFTDSSPICSTGCATVVSGG